MSEKVVYIKNNNFDSAGATIGDVVRCTYSSKEKCIGKFFIVANRKKCQHPDKDNIEVVPWWVLQHWGSYGDCFEIVKIQHKEIK